MKPAGPAPLHVAEMTITREHETAVVEYPQQAVEQFPGRAHDPRGRGVGLLKTQQIRRFLVEVHPRQAIAQRGGLLHDTVCRIRIDPCRAGLGTNVLHEFRIAVRERGLTTAY